MQKLSEKDVRALKLGAVGIVAVLLLIGGTKVLGHWSKVRASIAKRQADLKALDVGDAKQAGILSIVPAFEMPELLEEQKILFRSKFSDQLKKAGIKHEPLKMTPTGKSIGSGYRLLNVQCTAKCKFTQVLDLLARLNENPYLVAVEVFKIKGQKGKPQDVELNLTVSTVYALKK